MRRRRTYGDLPKPQIHLGPMVDVSLALLIMFILAIPFLVESGLFVSKAAVSQKKKTTHTASKDVKIQILLRENGEILLNGDPVSWSALDTLIPQLLLRSPTRRALLSADSAVRYDDVVHMIDFLKGKGVQDVLIVKSKSS